MKQFVFREDLFEARMMRRIQRQIETHRLISLVELCRSLKVPPGVVRPYIERMIARGAVRRLRPVQYSNDDRDFYHSSSLQPDKRSPASATLLNRMSNRASGWLMQVDFGALRPSRSGAAESEAESVCRHDVGVAAPAGA